MATNRGDDQTRAEVGAIQQAADDAQSVPGVGNDRLRGIFTTGAGVVTVDRQGAVVDNAPDNGVGTDAYGAEDDWRLAAFDTPPLASRRSPADIGYPLMASTECKGAPSSLVGLFLMGKTGKIQPRHHGHSRRNGQRKIRGMQ